MSEALGTSKWFPGTERLSVVTEIGEDSFRHCLESPKPPESGKVAENESFGFC